MRNTINTLTTTTNNLPDTALLLASRPRSRSQISQTDDDNSQDVINNQVSSLETSLATQPLEEGDAYVGSFLNAVNERINDGSFTFPTIIPDPSDPNTANIIDHTIFNYLNAHESPHNRRILLESIRNRFLSNEAVRILISNIGSVDPDRLDLILEVTQSVIGTPLNMLHPISNFFFLFASTGTINSSTAISTVRTILIDIRFGHSEDYMQALNNILNATTEDIDNESASASEESGKVHDEEEKKRKKEAAAAAARSRAFLIKALILAASSLGSLGIAGGVLVFSRSENGQLVLDYFRDIVRAPRIEPAELGDLVSQPERSSASSGSDGDGTVMSVLKSFRSFLIACGRLFYEVTKDK